MIKIRKSQERGKADHGWLKSFHSFSFADYRDRNHTHFQSLRVINEDYVGPNTGFNPHPHKDMEIITYVLSGQLAHEDSMGNTRVINAGEFQVMTAGSGVTHSEFNPSDTEPVHLLQIWIMPNQTGLKPAYAELIPEIKDGLTLVASLTGPLKINQDAKLFLGKLTSETNKTLEIDRDRHLWLQMIDGELIINGEKLASGDAAALSEESTANIRAETASHFLLFDLASY